ncbi:MAG: glutamate racemase [Wolinella sp.]
MRLGVFDSGVGGFSVLKSLVDSRAFREIIYFGDTARVPYGAKDSETIIRYSLEALEFLRAFDIDMMIVACNTVSAHALEELQQATDIDVIGVIEPGVLALRNRLKNLDSRILVLGTQATIASDSYPRLLRNLGYTRVESLATGLFVPIVEEGIFEGKVLESVMEHYFSARTSEPEAIILGCTHFPFIAPAIAEYFNNKPLLIHSGEAIMQYLGERYELDCFTRTEVRYFASENPAALIKRAKEWLIL